MAATCAIPLPIVPAPQTQTDCTDPIFFFYTNVHIRELGYPEAKTTPKPPRREADTYIFSTTLKINGGGPFTCLFLQYAKHIATVRPLWYAGTRHIQKEGKTGEAGCG